MTEKILDDEYIDNSTLRRRDLLPTWIKVFVWIFMITGAIIPVSFVIGLFGGEVLLSIYGIETMQTLSVKGILITLLFALKGVVAFGLWTEKKWAVDLAVADAVIGILVCGIVMTVLPFVNHSENVNMSFRLELLLIIPYLMKMRAISTEWKNSSPWNSGQ